MKSVFFVQSTKRGHQIWRVDIDPGNVVVASDIVLDFIKNPVAADEIAFQATLKGSL